MSLGPAVSTGEYEFDDSQNQLIGSLARKMGLVGFVMVFFGILQLINGVSTLVMSRSPDRVVAAAEKAGMPKEQLDILKKSLEGAGWSSPLVAYATAFVAAGLFLFLVGLWTRRAALGFAGIVLTKGKDVSRLMEALKALEMEYGLIYYMILIAAIVSFASLAFGLWQSWRGGA